MKNLVLVTALLISSTSFAEGFGNLTSKFRGQSLASKIFYVIEQGENGQWNLVENRPCPTFPCTPSDFSSTVSVNPEVLTSSVKADGNTEVQLGVFKKLIYINMWGQGSYWELQLLNRDGSVQEKIKMDFFPVFEQKVQSKS